MVHTLTIYQDYHFILEFVVFIHDYLVNFKKKPFLNAAISD